MITTSRFLVRPIRDSDLEAIYGIHSDAETNRYLPYDTWTSLGDAQRWYQKTKARVATGEGEQFVILRRDDDTLVGTCLSFRAPGEEAVRRLGYVLDRRHWGRGYMSEVIAAFIDFLWTNDAVERLEASVERGNDGSVRLLKKLGFSFVKTTLVADVELDEFVLHRS